MVEAKTVKLRGFSCLLLRIDFVDHEEYGLSRTPKKPGKFLVWSRDAGSAINDEYDKRCAINRYLGLFENALRDLGLLAGDDSTGVDNFVGMSMPTDNSVDSIACDAGLIGDDRPPLTDKTVEERGFPHVWASDNGNQRQ